jgi:BirA family biotin operon repressor/biotin-[acetyl-CoA-carboxylase] ligase
MECAPEIIQPAETNSTSSYLKELLKQRKLPECSAVITNHQKKGRGQPGNSWESMPGKNITFSIVLYPTMIEPSKQFILSKTIAVALAKTLEKEIGPVQIKWPNDLYFKNSKIGGILIENSLHGSIIDQSVVGIGININQEKFSEELPNAVSIKNITGRNTDLAAFFQSLYQTLIDHYLLLSEGHQASIEEDYYKHLFRRTGLHRYRDAQGTFEAEFSCIDPSGRLFLKHKNGEISKYAFKEVEFMLEA